MIDSAIDAFFVKGFDATTLSDLESATGVDRSTLYNSFGGKTGLYRAATARYLDRAATGLFGTLHDGSSSDSNSDSNSGSNDGSNDGLADIVQFLETLRVGLTMAEVSPGCLIVNDMAAGSDREAAARYRELLDSGLRAALGRAAGPPARPHGHRAAGRPAVGRRDRHQPDQPTHRRQRPGRAAGGRRSGRGRVLAR